MRKFNQFIFIAAVALFLGQTAQVSAQIVPDVLDTKVKTHVIKCNKKAQTSFAIITDSETYWQCAAQFNAYRDVLQQEGLGTYIIHADWQNPDQVKEAILKVASRRPKLEGIVLAGDVPVVMVREAQHMTTAFKMNEKTWPVFESSVPSDRFYDDFDLDFNYLGRDSLRQDTFYYRLTSQGALTLRSDIYSARIKVPAQMEGDKYELMRRYLEKVVAAHQEENVLDNMTYFAGHGYNSDCLTLWRQRPVVYREHFPYAFSKASQNRFLNFRQKDQMKDNLSVELQRGDCDFFQFSEHGAPDVQYINGSPEVSGAEGNYEALKSYVASYYRRYIKGTSDEEAFLKEAVDSAYLLPRSALSDSAMAVYDRRDSINTRNANLYLQDLAKLRSNPRMIVLNACYNGSFHNEEGYVAGFHIFGDGRCVVAQGNTVNVLQDKWEDKLLGYLSIGERAGMWQKEITFLESHLIGDPTFRFKAHNAAEEELCRDLHHALVFSPADAEVWREKIYDQHPLVRAAAITHLSYGEGNWSSEALQLLQADPSWTVRLSALQALGKYMDENTVAGIQTAFHDPYEAIVRTACRIAGASGDPVYLEDLQELMKTRLELARVSFIAGSSIKVINGKFFAKTVARIHDKSLKTPRRIDAMRSFRNNRVLSAIEPLLEVVQDKEEVDELRQVAAEVLGWYDQSIRRSAILAELEQIKDRLPELVAEEVRKTIKRLEWN